MYKPIHLRETMDMPDPYFPIKVLDCRCAEYGSTLFPHHWHQHIEFLYFRTGKAMIECNSDPSYVNAGELVVVNSNDVHYGVCMSDDLYYIALIVDLSIIHSRTADAAETNFIVPVTQNRIMFRHHISNDSEINLCMDALFDVLNQKRFGYELSVKSYLYRLLALLLRNYASQLPITVDDQERLRNLQRLAPVVQYIEDHNQEELSVRKLASIAGLSRFHFSRQFKSLTGSTITEYINKIRIDKSEYLLRNTPMWVTEVALASGYKDVYYFSRLFKKHKKITPSEARRKPERDHD